MEISKIIKEARIKKGMTQQQLADSVYVNNEEKTILQKLAHNKQTIFLIVIALVSSPIIIGIRYCLFTMGKLEDKRFKIVIQTVGFILFAFYLRSLKDNVAYFLIFITSFIYLTYQYYMFSLEND